MEKIKYNLYIRMIGIFIILLILLYIIYLNKNYIERFGGKKKKKAKKQVKKAKKQEKKAAKKKDGGGKKKKKKSKCQFKKIQDIKNVGKCVEEKTEKAVKKAMGGLPIQGIADFFKDIPGWLNKNIGGALKSGLYNMTGIDTG